MTGSSLGMPKSRASLCGSPRRAQVGLGVVRDGCHRDGSTAVGETRARTNLARESAPPPQVAIRQTLWPHPREGKYTTKLLVFDIGDARNARRGSGCLRLSRCRRVREARLHLQDRAPHPVDEAFLAQIIAFLENLLEDERRRTF